MKSDMYNAQGKKAGSVELPESVFGVKWNDALMHQVVTSMQSNARTPVAHVKNRGDVRGGGRKPWQQKGTGRARHGSIRSPIWKGGGVTHGPRKDRNYAKQIPKKMRAKALFMVLSKKFADGEVAFIDSFGLTAPKTAQARSTLVALAKNKGLEGLMRRNRAALVAIPEVSVAAAKSFNNIGSVECELVRNLNPVSVLKHKYLVIENPKASVVILEGRANSKKLKAKS